LLQAEKVRLSSEIEKLIVEKQTINTLKEEIEKLKADIQSKDEQVIHDFNVTMRVNQPLMFSCRLKPRTF
jgi:hypothetical protein